MNKLYLLFPILLFSCQPEAPNYCDEIEKSTRLLENRIDFTLKEIDNSEESISERRYQSLKYNIDDILANIKQLKDNILAEKNAETEVSNIKQILTSIATNLDMNSNVLDNSICKQLELCKEELESLLTLKNNDCASLTTFQITAVEEHIFSILYTISKTEKYLFTKIEVIPLPFEKGIYQVSKYDSLGIAIGKFAYDSTKHITINYWIDDSLKNPKNMKTFTGLEGQKIYFKGIQGLHKVYGDLEVLEHGRKVWRSWDVQYEVK